MRYAGLSKCAFGAALIASAWLTGCASDVGEESETRTASAALLGQDTFLYLRCNATSWLLGDASRLDQDSPPEMFRLTYEVTQEWMVTGFDQCAVVETNQLDNWGTAQTNYNLRNATQIDVPASGAATAQLKVAQQGESTHFNVKYPELGTYVATVNWANGSLQIQKEAPAEEGLYLRCGSTGMDFSESSRLQPTTDPYLFTLDFDVTDPAMVAGSDSCWVTDTNNGSVDHGAQTAGTVQVPQIGKEWTRLGSAAEMLEFQYPELGKYRATVNWRDGYIAIHKLKSQTYLYMRLRFTDDAPDYVPQTDASINAEVDGVEQSYYTWSAGQVVVDAEVTPTLTLPHDSAYYVRGTCSPYPDSAGWTGMYDLIDDALLVAQGLGYDTDYYNVHSVRYERGPGCGFSWGGGSTTWLGWDGVTFHEWGHNLGLPNEGAFRSLTSAVLNPSMEYEGDNAFSAMHNNDPNSVFTIPDLTDMGIVDDGVLIQPTTSGTYRIYTHQVSALSFDTNKKYALQLVDGGRSLTFEYHHLIPASADPNASSGLIVLLTDSNELIDATPYSQASAAPDRFDAPLPLGTALPSWDGTWTVTPVAVGGSGGSTYMDVQVVFH